MKKRRFVTQTSIRKRPDDIQVRAFDQHGTRFPAGDYFTDDMDDAKDTAAAMCSEGVAKLGAHERKVKS